MNLLLQGMPYDLFAYSICIEYLPYTRPELNFCPHGAYIKWHKVGWDIMKEKIKMAQEMKSIEDDILNCMNRETSQMA